MLAAALSFKLTHVLQGRQCEPSSGLMYVCFTVECWWAGGVEETFSCPEPGVLHVTSVVTVGARSETTLQVRGCAAAC